MVVLYLKQIHQRTGSHSTSIDESLNLESSESADGTALTADYTLFEYQRSKMRTETVSKSDELKSALNALNIGLQSLICHFVRNIDDQFHFPSILVAVLAPMATQRIS